MPRHSIKRGMNLKKQTSHAKEARMNRGQNNNNTVKPLLSGHVRDLPKCPLNRGCPFDRGCKTCAMSVMLNRGSPLNWGSA